MNLLPGVQAASRMPSARAPAGPSGAAESDPIAASTPRTRLQLNRRTLAFMPPLPPTTAPGSTVPPATTRRQREAGTPYAEKVNTHLTSSPRVGGRSSPSVDLTPERLRA